MAKLIKIPEDSALRVYRILFQAALNHPKDDDLIEAVGIMAGTLMGNGVEIGGVVIGKKVW